MIYHVVRRLQTKEVAFNAALEWNHATNIQPPTRLNQLDNYTAGFSLPPALAAICRGTISLFRRFHCLQILSSLLFDHQCNPNMTDMDTVHPHKLSYPLLTHR
jgi:hypothetical protein